MPFDRDFIVHEINCIPEDDIGLIEALSDYQTFFAGWFLHLSKKERIYCSPNCGFRMAGRRRIAALQRHPKKYAAYKKKQRQAMKEIYDRRKMEKSAG